jgi:hypothetical protein
MGATLWFHEVTWQPDARLALQQLQIEIFGSKYNFPAELEAWKRDTQAALAGEKATGDSFALPIHDKTGVPTHWFFIGNTVD